MKKLCIGNWKMNCNLEQIEKYKLEDKSYNHIEISIAVPSPYLTTLYNHRTSSYSICAQDISKYQGGAYTGEVGGIMLKDCGTKYVIVGHSERRSNFNENPDITEKLLRCIENDLEFVLCIGETTEERNSLKVFDVLEKQLSVFSSLNDLKCINVAYEPVWCIGTGKVIEVDELISVLCFIKSIIERYNCPIRILYGGSVNSSIYKTIMSKTSVDGFLIGNASLDVIEFTKIVEGMEEYYSS